MTTNKSALPVKTSYKSYVSVRKGETYEKPVYLENMTEYAVEKDIASDPFYAEGTIKTSSTTLKEIPVTLSVADLTTENDALIHGHTISQEGGIVRCEGDIAPEVALIVSDMKSDGSIVATIYYSGQFTPSGRSGATSEGSANYQVKTTTAMFKPTKVGTWNGLTDYEFTLANEAEFEKFVETLKIPTKKTQG